MKFSKTPQELFDFIAQALKGFHCEGKRMFGGVGYFVNKNMFTGVHQSSLFLRLSQPDQKAIMEQFDEIVNFEPLPGRKMKEYVTIPESIYSEAGMLGEWLEKSYKYAFALPPKKSKKKGAKREA